MYNVPKKNHIDFHNGSNYDYYFIIKNLAEEFKKQFTCNLLTVPIEKELTIFHKKMEKKLWKIYSNYDNNKFISLLQKGVYSYEYMDDW